jgi:hypothetical protein
MGCCTGGPRLGGAGLVHTVKRKKTREQILEELRQASQPIEVDGGYIIKNSWNLKFL